TPGTVGNFSQILSDRLTGGSRAGIMFGGGDGVCEIGSRLLQLPALERVFHGLIDSDETNFSGGDVVHAARDGDFLGGKGIGDDRRVVDQALHVEAHVLVDG